MYKFKNVGKSMTLCQCNIRRIIFTPFKKTSLKKIGIVALSKERDRADKTSKNDKNATKKNVKLKFSFNNSSAFINDRNCALNKKYKSKNNMNPIIGIIKVKEIN